jgi:hypothetical protein
MGDPGVEEGTGYKRLPRLIVVGKLLLSLLGEGVGRSIVCFMVLGSVNVDVVFGDESEVVKALKLYAGKRLSESVIVK